MASTLFQPTPARTLGLATAATFCALAAMALAITLTGKVHRADVTIDLAAPATPKAAIAAAAPAATPNAPPVSIDKAVFAGHALVADPALIENSPQGPLPRIADDGRKPMAA